jgi:HK97 family phage prohead protease
MTTEHRAPEQRTIDVDVKDIDTRGRTLHGYAAVYGVESHDLGGFRERIAPGAFSTVLDGDVRALLNHDPSQVLGRSKSGTLRLFDEQRGLRFEVDLPDSPLGENVREAVRRGDIDGASFRFVVDRDSWDGDLRTVESVRELKDVTVATFGAYPAASVELRTRDGAQRQEETKVDENNKETEERTAPPAGSLRVEERAEIHEVRSLAELFEQRGFPGTVASVSFGEFRALTWSGGTVLTDMNPTRRAGVSLGYDQRWAYPAFPSTSVDSATTAVQVLRQSSRTLPAGTAIIRPIDAVTTKPEVDTVTELVSQQLSQVAAVSSNVPNIIGEQVAFRSMVETDLRLGISEGYDRLVLNGLATAGTLTAGTAGDVIQKVRRGISQLATAGYAADTLVIDAAGAENLDLMTTSGDEAFYVWSPGNFAGDLFNLNRRVTKAAGTAVVDSQAFGRLYASPLSLQRFEVDAGLSNRSNYRLEGHATFGVERVTAGVRII